MPQKMPHPLFDKLRGRKVEYTGSPQELLAKARAALVLIDQPVKGKELDKAKSDANKYVGVLAHVVRGDDNAHEADSWSQEAVIVMRELLATDTIVLVIDHLADLDFETRKDAVSIFALLCKYVPAHAEEPLGLSYVQGHPAVLGTLCRGYRDSSVALNYGSMLRDALRSEHIASHVLHSDDLLNQMFEYVQLNAFEVASDAFHTFKKLMTAHGAVVTEYLSDDDNYDKFFSQYQRLLTSDNYATQRQLMQSLTLLAELLLEQRNIVLMFKFVTSAKNLMDIMNLLRSTSRSIQYEAFHIFKVFVANPKKPDTIKSILISNRTKLLRFLRSFLEEREQDEAFLTEKEDVMAEIERLQLDDERMRASPSMVAARMDAVMSFSNLASQSTGRGLDDDSSRLPSKLSGGGSALIYSPSSPGTTSQEMHHDTDSREGHSARVNGGRSGGAHTGNKGSESSLVSINERGEV